MIKCACGEKECVGNIKIDGKTFWVTNGDNEEVMIYLDASAKVALIAELKESLLQV